VSDRPVDLYGLPDDLSPPGDDGAADHLLNASVPSIELPSTGDEPVKLANIARETLVLYVYPQTGIPGQPVPDGWNQIPGARGCTPQSCAFRDRAQALVDLGAAVFGLSAQSLDEQHEFAEREHLPYPLLNDSEFRLSEELELPTFKANGARSYRRLTFIARRESSRSSTPSSRRRPTPTKSSRGFKASLFEQIGQRQCEPR